MNLSTMNTNDCIIKLEVERKIENMFLFFTPKIKSILSWECFFIRCRNVEMASVKKRATPKNEKGFSNETSIGHSRGSGFHRLQHFSSSPHKIFSFLFIFLPTLSLLTTKQPYIFFCNRISLSLLHSFQNFVLFNYSIGPKSKFLKNFEEKFFGRNLFLHIRFETQPAILSFGWK